MFAQVMQLRPCYINIKFWNRFQEYDSFIYKLFLNFADCNLEIAFLQSQQDSICESYGVIETLSGL